jgi:multidrug efflux pump subunit AcrB
MWLAQSASLQRRSILFLLLVAAVAGVYAGLNLPVALFPKATRKNN